MCIRDRIGAGYDERRSETSGDDGVSGLSELETDGAKRDGRYPVSYTHLDVYKRQDMYMKCQYMDELTNGKGIVFATGTPLSNSMVELYTNCLLYTSRCV